MKLLMIGSGGREHALIRKFKESKRITEIHCAPGNGGISKDAVCHPVSGMDIEGVVKLAKEIEVDVVFVAPDDPLAAGLVDALEAEEIRAFGPNKDAAVIEASKVFSKNLMKKYGIPTAGYEVFSSSAEALGFIKASGKYPVRLISECCALRHFI